VNDQVTLQQPTFEHLEIDAEEVEIGRQLRMIYAQVVGEGMPPRLAEILRGPNALEPEG
jgi:hypothetical protein